MRTEQLKHLPFRETQKLQKASHDYMSLAIKAQKAKNRSLFDHYYQLAEHCLRLANAPMVYLSTVQHKSPLVAKKRL